MSFPTCFLQNRSIPPETKLGLFMTLFLTQKHLTGFANTKHRNRNTRKRQQTCLASPRPPKRPRTPAQNPDPRPRPEGAVRVAEQRFPEQGWQPGCPIAVTADLCWARGHTATPAPSALQSCAVLSPPRVDLVAVRGPPGAVTWLLTTRAVCSRGHASFPKLVWDG